MAALEQMDLPVLSAMVERAARVDQPEYLEMEAMAPTARNFLAMAPQAARAATQVNLALAALAAPVAWQAPMERTAPQSPPVAMAETAAMDTII